ncbi:BMC_2a_G0023680.mRNA.1.CDS.1 [Saccharomyces cerevisiae]|nr:Crh1p [Saccharomyces cerevisiae YJM1447]CAI4474971.1 BMC_2a_G0023680.mRNA.1.CDS.1 [Saccharomyces cerevisiae]CAI4476736.1 BMB_G0023710.mRNA.1.CDS.1 [Saccharomyces cerevisiae]CAI7121414.1 BMC_2a_G0023680.mRNA.1.CDS.1 [Saccharomyces cerevisiae]CAI7122849.1 BMB_G0023710.mRNA.1.CDS.1 [Saccharomyces cerevisiae]
MKVLDLLTVLSASSLLSTFAAAESTATADSTTAASSTASCNPLKTTGCTPDTALATSFSEDFSSSSKWFTDLKHAGEIKYGSDGLSMTLAKRYDNPSLKSNFYIMYGKLEVILKAANGTGIVSSFYLQSDDLDEIDIEWVGGDNTQFQSNFFSKGDTTTYDRGEFHGVDTPTDKFHNYTLDWAMDKTTWYLDGESVRVLSNTSSEGYPQSPMYLMMGIWAGGDPDNAAGTIEWAGGETNYNDAPFTMYIEKVIVTDYSTGKKYTYGDQSGSWESIEADGGSIYGRYDQAQEDFAVLANGGSISSSSTSSSTVSSSAFSTVSSSVSSTVSPSSSVSSSSSTSPSSSTATSSKTLASSSVTTSSSISSFEKQSSSSSKKTVASSSTSESIISSTKTPATVSSTTRSTVAPTTQQSSVSSDSPVQDKGGVATSSNDVTSSATQISSKYTSTIQSSSSEASSTNSVQISNGADLAQSLPREGRLFSVLVALLALL